MSTPFINLRAIGAPYGACSASETEDDAPPESYFEEPVRCPGCADVRSREMWCECNGCDAVMCPMKEYQP